MESQTLMLVVIAVLVVAALAVAAWLYSARRRRAQLRERFGPEYDRAVRETGAPEKADALLEGRVRRVQQFKIHPLSRDQAQAFSTEWRRVQAMFVDDPVGAVSAADALVTQVMSARGYPIEDFDTRAADLSVDHPRVVENYRAARTLAERNRRGEASTEELRQAVVNYRALFDDLLDVPARSIRRAS